MRVKTGIHGLDELVGGGFPRGSCVLAMGKVGTGKSIFAMQYIANGIQEYGEPGVFVSLERERKALYDDASAFGWQLQRLEKEGSLQILGGPIASVAKAMKKAEAAIEDIFDEIAEAVEGAEAKRAAVDGVEKLAIFAPDEVSLKLQLGDLKDRLAGLGCTTLLTCEVDEEGLSKLGIEDVVDGVIVLYYEGEGLTRDRALEVRKMRGTAHSNQLHFFDITDKGIVIKKLPEVPRGGCEGSSGGPNLPTRCLFCGKPMDNPAKLREGGRASFCDSCLRKLERKGLLRKLADGTVELRKPLMEVIANYR